MAAVTVWTSYGELAPLTLFSGISGENGLHWWEEVRRALRAKPTAGLLRRPAAAPD